MGLRERDRTETPAPPHPPTPRPADRLRRPLALAAAVAALLAFTTLARPQASPSSRLRVGAVDEPETVAEDPPQRTPVRQGPQTLVRPVDPATLADVPANILTLGADEWIWPSGRGALLALHPFSDQGQDDIAVVDARTFQPVVTLDAQGVVHEVSGFTPAADAVIALTRVPYPRRSVLRYPLDPEQAVTGVELPEGVELASNVAMLPDGRVAMVVTHWSDEDPASVRSPVRVLVADLLDERIVVDLPLPGVRADFIYGVPEAHASQALPGFAWDAARARLYVVHADVARVSVVDLLGGTLLAEAVVGPALPAMSEEPGQRSRWAQVSPDGTRLYTAGYESSARLNNMDLFGLSVIDTATLSEIGRVEDVVDPQLSPDGRWLMWTRNPSWTGLGSPNQPPRVALMDTEQIGHVHLLGDRTAAYPLGFSRDSSHAYLQRDEISRGVVVAHALPSLTPTGDRVLSRDAWFDPTTGLLHEPR